MSATAYLGSWCAQWCAGPDGCPIHSRHRSRRRRRGLAGKCHLRKPDTGRGIPEVSISPSRGGEALAVSQTTRHAPRPPGPLPSLQQGPARVVTAGVGGAIQRMARRWLPLPFAVASDATLHPPVHFPLRHRGVSSWAECELHGLLPVLR